MDIANLAELWAVTWWLALSSTGALYIMLSVFVWQYRRILTEGGVLDNLLIIAVVLGIYFEIGVSQACLAILYTHVCLLLSIGYSYTSGLICIVAVNLLVVLFVRNEGVY